MSLIKSVFPYPVLDTVIENWEECKLEIKKGVEVDKDTELPTFDGASYTTNSKFICERILDRCPKTKKQIEDFLKIFTDEVGIKNLKITDSWINEYHYQQFLPPHNHLPHQVTGTLFIDIPPEGGEFFFSKPSVDTDQIFLKDGYSKISDFSNPTWLIRPTEGQLLIFMSNLYHASAPVKTKDFIRYTLAFNANLSAE